MLESKDVAYLKRLEDILKEAADILVAVQISQGLMKDPAKPATAEGRPQGGQERKGNSTTGDRPQPVSNVPDYDSGGNVIPGNLTDPVDSAQNPVTQANSAKGGSQQVAGQSQGTSKQGNKSGG